MSANKKIICGGTFDRLHKGHREFISFARNKGDSLVIGLTSDAYILELKKDLNILSFAERKKELELFIKAKQLTNIEIVAIEDMFGPLLQSDSPILVVSQDTHNSAITINKERAVRGLTPLSIIVFPWVNDLNNLRISSTRIRNGEIDRDGQLYVSEDWYMHDRLLPESLRGEFKKPFGDIVTNLDSHLKLLKKHADKVVTVGDITTQLFNENNIDQSMSVVDFIVERKKKFGSLEDLGFSGNEITINAENKPGGISANFAFALGELVQSKSKRAVVLVMGEEDMAVLFLLLLLPLDFYIEYGQPGVGMVSVKVTEEKKSRAHSLATQFIIQD